MYYDNNMKQMIKLLELKGCTQGTIDKYCACTKKFLTFLGKPTDDITTDDILEYLYHMISLGRANSTINHNHSIFNFFFSKVLRKPDVVSSIPYMRRAKKLPEILSSKELESIFDSSRSLKMKAVFMTAYSSGLRVGELVRLKVSDIDSSRMQLRIIQKGCFFD